MHEGTVVVDCATNPGEGQWANRFRTVRLRKNIRVREVLGASVQFPFIDNAGVVEVVNPYGAPDLVLVDVDRQKAYSVRETPLRESIDYAGYALPANSQEASVARLAVRRAVEDMDAIVRDERLAKMNEDLAISGCGPA